MFNKLLAIIRYPEGPATRLCHQENAEMDSKFQVATTCFHSGLL